MYARYPAIFKRSSILQRAVHVKGKASILIQIFSSLSAIHKKRESGIQNIWGAKL